MLLGTAEGRDYLVEFWEKVASRYKGHPAIFGYNLINEPHSREIKTGDPSLPEQYDRLIKAIRKIDQVTPIIIECDQMSAPQLLQFLPIYDSPNIIYSVHMYMPGGLTHQLNPKAESFSGYPDAEKKWNKEYLRSELKIRSRFPAKNRSADIHRRIQLHPLGAWRRSIHCRLYLTFRGIRLGLGLPCLSRVGRLERRA
jgi:hypothetical protein